MPKRNRLDMRIDPDLKEAAEAVAEERGMSLSELLRNYMKRITARKRSGVSKD